MKTSNTLTEQTKEPKYTLSDMVDPIYQARAVAKLFQEFYFEADDSTFKKSLTKDDVFNIVMVMDNYLERIENIRAELD